MAARVLVSPPRLAFTSVLDDVAVRMAKREVTSYDCTMGCTPSLFEVKNVYQKMPP